ncbi:MAG: alpha/beta fold hydrolase [Deinococcales bacterium]
MPRPLVRGLILAWALLVGCAAAQTYQIRQAGQALGTFQLDLTRSVAGTVSDSSLTLTGVADLHDHLVVDASGHAVSYRLQGTARGTPVTIQVAIQAHQAAFTIDQGGSRHALEVPLPGPVVIIDNNMLDGWQVVASQLEADGSAPQHFDVLVPQAARTGTLAVTPAGKETVRLGDASVDAQRYHATLEVGGTRVGVTLWLGASGSIVAFAQPSASVRFDLETPASRAKASAEAAATASARATFEEHLAAQRRCVREHDVHVQSTGATLAGTLSVPTGASASRPAPALLLLPGSGAVDRHGNAPPSITNGMYQQLAYDLGCQGYAVLRIDKLGIGASTGDANAVTLGTYAHNTADWMALLRSRPGIDPRRIGLMGHSEGGLVALYATARGIVHPTAVVLLESPGIPMGTLIVDQLTRLARLRGASPDEVAATEAQARQAIEAIRASTGTALPLDGDLANNPVAAAFAHAAGLLRSEIDEDPAALAARIEVPVLVVQGGKDVQVLPRNGEALAKAAPHATYLYVPDLEHDLYETTGSAIDHASPGPGTLLATDLLDALHAYLAGYLMAAR